ncbi:Glutamate dehydrogenase [subsurface metagenome]
MEATGTGAFFVTKEAIKDLGLTKNESIAVQGFGDVGCTVAKLLYNEGFKVIAVSDIKGGIYSKEGLDIEKLSKYVENTGFVTDFPETVEITNEDLLEINCDILIPAAIQSVITDKNADKVKAKLIIEGANGPTTTEAEKIFEEKGVTIIPDVLANCGGAIVCSFERTQGLTDTYWDLETVNKKLKKRILKAYKETFATAKEKDTSFRNAAWMNALIKISKAMKARGWM